jgi:hypothetical protein
MNLTRLPAMRGARYTFKILNNLSPRKLYLIKFLWDIMELFAILSLGRVDLILRLLQVGENRVLYMINHSYRNWLACSTDHMQRIYYRPRCESFD